MCRSSRKTTCKSTGFEIQGTERGQAHKAHNHPSGVAEPSSADELITRRLKDALQLVDIRVLDHLVVAGAGCISFAERGLL